MSKATKPLENLTRWNRAGLSRFDYVDGDAAVWLEELRIALLGLYLRGGDPETRLPQHWRDIYLRDQADWPDVAAAAERVAWKRLSPDMPPQQETRGRRNERLLRQYNDRTNDHAWEISRAFARATHILLGYLNAYANEGYLRTATQWENLRRLAAMVNYQPTPPASATATVGLIMKDDAGDVVIPAGLAMKHTPPEGGPPLIFETLEAVGTHPALNAARAELWNENQTSIPLGAGSESHWHLAEDESLATGDLAVIAEDQTAEALIVSSVTHDTDAELVHVEFDEAPAKSYSHFSTRLWIHPGDVRIGLKTSKTGQLVVKAEGIGSVNKGDLIEVFVKGHRPVVEVLAADGGEIVLDMDLPADDDTIELRPMLPYALDDNDGVDKITRGTEKMWVTTYGTPQPKTASDISYGEGDKPVAGLMRFAFSNPRSDRAFAVDARGKKFEARIRRRNPEVLPGRDKRGDKAARQTNKTVTFEGKPPKGLADDDWFVARNIATGTLTPLQVNGIRVASGTYHVEFNQAPIGNHDNIEFHGPMTLALTHDGYDRNPKEALKGNKVVLQDIPSPARQLIKPGRTVFIRKQAGKTDQTVSARVEEAKPLADDQLELTLSEYDAAADWACGDTSFALNTVQISHGETKDSKVLGSGDGERSAQVFEFDVKNLSHIPSTSAEAGVAPDMTIAVDGERWDYRDFIDPSAAGTRSWSTTITDTGTLRINFRRRLVTGQNNVVVTRYRVGVGIAGSNIAPFSFAKPMKKHRSVAGIFQPFATSGGADREPVSKLRESTPKRLSANGRAVSLSDFEHLATRHASIMRARAVIVPTAVSQKMVMLTVALVGKGKVETLAADLAPSITARSLPGVGVSFRDYIQLPLKISVTVRSDLSVHNRTDIKAAALARLTETFSLENRDFGQTAYVSEVLAALETVDGIENAIVDDFDIQEEDTATASLSDEDRKAREPRNIATVDGKIAAIYPTDRQIIHVSDDASAALNIVVETTQ